MMCTESKSVMLTAQGAFGWGGLVETGQLLRSVSKKFNFARIKVLGNGRRLPTALRANREAIADSNFKLSLSKMESRSYEVGFRLYA